MKNFILMCLLLFIHTSQSQIYHQMSTEGADVSLICKHEGKVQWSKDRDGYRLMILTAESKEEIKKLSADPHNRYSVKDDLDLHIKNVSLSDSGIYYCNANPTVNLSVTSPEIYHQRSTERADVSLICKHEGKVQWSKDRDGNRLMILTAESKEEMKKTSADPHNRYSVGDELDLHIKNVSLSDSGIYYCNANPAVNLTVTASDGTEATASPICTPEHTTKTPDSSTRTAYTSYCIKENK